MTTFNHVDHSVIKEFQGPYRFLSNFTPVQVVMDGLTYPSVEHAFQAAKTVDPLWRAKIIVARTAADAKKLGKRVPMRRDWNANKLSVMEDLLRQKFNQEPYGMNLAATVGKKIIEGNRWHDNYWGACYCEKCQEKRGQFGSNMNAMNHMGRLLMKIREELCKGIPII